MNTIQYNQQDITTARKVSKYGASSGPHLSIFGLNTGKYGTKKTPHLDTFHVVKVSRFFTERLILT